MKHVYKDFGKVPEQAKTKAIESLLADAGVTLTTHRFTKQAPACASKADKRKAMPTIMKYAAEMKVTKHMLDARVGKKVTEALVMR